MAITDRARQVLLAAESELRQLITEAAQQGDYRAAELIANLAGKVNSISAGTGPSTNGFSHGAEHHAGTARDSEQTTHRQLSSRPRKKAASHTTRNPKGYPKFARYGDSLVKTGWSKNKKSEYKHKSPRSVLFTVTATLGRLFSDNDIVPMESVLPIRSDDGSDVPGYQVYLCVAWLRTIGAVRPVGREGYSRAGSTRDLAIVVEDEWNKLPLGDLNSI